MKRLLNLSVLLVLAAVAVTGRVRAQGVENYPVSITPVIYPPYPPSVKYLNASASPSLVLTITNKSLNAGILNVKLAVSIECMAFTTQSKPVINGLAPISLSAGIPTRLTNLDIAAAYAFDNLAGLTINQYENALPETKIVYGFVLYDAITGRQVSDKVTYSVINSLNNPPVTTLPDNAATVTEQGMQNVLFQWQPRQLTAGGGVQYILELIELLDKSQNPQSAFLTTAPIFTDSTFLNRYIYGPDLPPLIPGKSYAWRVQAKSSDNGGNQTQSFRNQGYSNIASFNYYAACKSPTMLQAGEIDKESAGISWMAPSGYENFLFSYRPKGTDKWTDITLTANSDNNYGLTMLAATTTYEIKVQSVCDNGVYASSMVKEFTTTDKAGARKKIEANCGQQPPVKQHAAALLDKLQAKDMITSGDFTIEVGEGVTGQNGYFSGKGIIELWIGKTFRIPVSFEKIKINKDYEVLEGKVIPAPGS
jgi:hypothetical protein